MSAPRFLSEKPGDLRPLRHRDCGTDVRRCGSTAKSPSGGSARDGLEPRAIQRVVGWKPARRLSLGGAEIATWRASSSPRETSPPTRNRQAEVPPDESTRSRVLWAQAARRRRPWRSDRTAPPQGGAYSCCNRSWALMRTRFPASCQSSGGIVALAAASFAFTASRSPVNHSSTIGPRRFCRSAAARRLA